MWFYSNFTNAFLVNANEHFANEIDEWKWAYSKIAMKCNVINQQHNQLSCESNESEILNGKILEYPTECISIDFENK